MITEITQVALLVRDYDEAKKFYTEALGFVVLEDTPMGAGKRWVKLGTPTKLGSELILSRAANDEQAAHIGKQAGGRVFLFMNTDNFNEDYARMKKYGVEFTEEPRTEEYGKVVVLKDLYGNRIDLIERR